MRKSVAALIAALAVLSFQFGVAHADTSAVTATVSGNTIGSRTLTVPATTSLITSSGVATLSGSIATTVTEAAKQGSNPWNVTAVMSNLVNGGSTITPDNMTIGTRSTVQTLGGGTLTYPAADGSDLSAARVLVNDVQSTSNVYTGSYITTTPLTLAIPNGSAQGAYTGTMTITLFP